MRFRSSNFRADQVRALVKAQGVWCHSSEVMAMATAEGTDGVAIVDGQPTPPASNAPSQHPSPLPQPRKHPLKPGGPRESDLIRYLDHGVNNVQKRVDNRVTNRKHKPAPGEAEGYKAFWEVAKDLDGLVDVVWVSGSPNLQIPYLLNLAVLAAEFLPLFASSTPSTQATFRLLSKLDYAFSSLLAGYDAATGDRLPGFECGRTVTTTDKVRLKGIVDRTRLTVTRVLSKESVVDDEDDVGGSMDTDTEDETDAGGRQGTVTFEGFENNEDDESDEDWEERGVATVYERTIGELGDVLGGPPIGIITDDWEINGAEQKICSERLGDSRDGIEL
ncbi:meiotic recombination dmc1 [Pyrenophora seminiperda CCB06]|uniref:Meiotic recombination dmc1 n=1 Tax=Pyrenophora seminiperda CCB06 TaxID=1302712 RepID=A0A3M7LYW2_9PLEO|nr:meiotic recombination dmc1 [Pyrenophora seminiperda CCB06]